MIELKSLTQNEIVTLLSPHIELNKNRHSLYELKQDTDGLMKKAQITGEPQILTLNGNIIAIVCDPKTFVELEQRRKKLEGLLDDLPKHKSKSGSFSPNIGRLRDQPQSSNIQEIKRCVRQIEARSSELNRMKCSLYDLEEKLAEAERDLELASKKASANSAR